MDIANGVEASNGNQSLCWYCSEPEPCYCNAHIADKAGWPDILIKATIDDQWQYGLFLRGGIFIVCEGVQPAAGGSWVRLRGVDPESCSANVPKEMVSTFWNERGIEIPLSEIVAVVEATS